MKALRIIGSVVGGLLIPVTAILLCAMLFLYSAAGLITNKTIENVVRKSMENETVQASIGNMLFSQFSATTPEGSQPNSLQSAVSDLMMKPSIQQALSDVINDSVNEMMSGSFDGELNIEEKVVEAIVSNPETLNQITSDMTDVMVESGALLDMMSGSGTVGTVLGDLSEETTQELLSDSEVQALISEVLAATITNTLTPENAQSIDFAGEIGTIIENNPTLFEEVIHTYIPDEETKQQIIEAESAYAEQLGVTPPDSDLTDTELVCYLLDLYQKDINQEINAMLGFYEVDYSDFDPDIAFDAPASSSISITFDQKTTDMINKLSACMNIFRHVLFLTLIFAVFVLFYFFMALLMWSFRYPLIFSSITAILTGILLIVIGALPIKDIMTLIDLGEYAELILELLDSVWDVLSDALMIAGAIGILLGLLMITAFILTGMYMKKKHRELQPA